MMRKGVLRFRLDQPLELTTRLPVIAVQLQSEGQEEPLVHPSIAEEHAALRAELVRVGGGVAAA
jgi:hypothetical protein